MLSKKLTIAGLSVLCLVAILLAAPRKEIFVSKVYTNEGNSRTGIAVSVSSTSWTMVLPKDSIRRSALIQTLSSSAGTICLSTTTDSNLVCGVNTPGIRIEPGKTYTDNSEAPLYGRLADGVAGPVYIYGMIFKDTNDSGDMNY